MDDKKELSGFTKNVFDIVDMFAVAVALMSIIGAFLVKNIEVKGLSMMNTLHDKDRVLLTNFNYEPKSGDIVVIMPSEKVKAPIIKRVIAVGGQKLRIDFEKQEVYVDDKLLDEPYISSKIVNGSGKIPEVVDEGKVFVMGDNRSNSLDSRFDLVGQVDTKNIVGKAQFILWPFDRLKSPYKLDKK